jgi:elongation factor G-like protein
VQKRRVAYLVGEAEGRGRYVRQHSGPGLYGVVRLRVSPGEGDRPIVTVASALPPGDSVAEYLPGIVRGITLAAYESSLFGARVVIVGGQVHEVDSSSQAFAKAAHLALLDALRQGGTRHDEVDEALYPTVRTVTAGARLVTEGVDVEIEPTEEPRDERPVWSVRWSTFDRRFEPALNAAIDRLAGAAPPWVDLRAAVHAGVEAGRSTSEEALHRALAAAVAAAGPVVRPKAGPDVVLHEGS